MSIGNLFNIIKEITKRGISVVTMVSDMVPLNVGLRKKLLITEGSPYFSNPSDTSKKIYVFHDVPYLIKLLRNFF
uniref:Transposable element P transposase n=1 Tax=Lepeophtheirus salmonis TaxID=72036 RepID=A0A0K2UT75_LEPSM